MVRGPSLSLRNIFQKIIVVGILGAFVLVGYSVFQSGLKYVYDSDEIMRMHEAYLYGTGTIPYTEHFSIYSPIFAWFLMPFLKLFDFTFAAFENARFVMALLFFLRIVLVGLISRMLLNWRAALVSMSLLLLDAFSVFSGSHIRVDNLMLTVFLLGTYLFIDGFIRNHKIVLFFGAFVLTIGCFIIIKIAPSFGIIIGGSLLFLLIHKKYTNIMAIVSGIVVAVCLYCIPFILQGNLREMITDTIILPAKFQSTHDYPVYVGFFYGANNPYIYGLGGRPITWMMEWILPVLAFAGVYAVVHGFMVRRRISEKKELFFLLLALCLVTQWGALFTLQTAYIQYYIPVLWLFAIFGGQVIESFLVIFEQNIFLYALFVGILLFIFGNLCYVSYQANLARSTIGNEGTIKRFTHIWSVIPEGAATFPHVLFRPIAFPLEAGYFTGVHSNLLSEFETIESVLEQKKVPYVVAGDYLLSYVSEKTKNYIQSHYHMIDTSESIWIRNELSEKK